MIEPSEYATAIMKMRELCAARKRVVNHEIIVAEVLSVLFERPKSEVQRDLRGHEHEPELPFL